MFGEVEFDQPVNINYNKALKYTPINKNLNEYQLHKDDWKQKQVIKQLDQAILKLEPKTTNQQEIQLPVIYILDLNSIKTEKKQKQIDVQKRKIKQMDIQKTIIKQNDKIDNQKRMQKSCDINLDTQTSYFCKIKDIKEKTSAYFQFLPQFQTNQKSQVIHNNDNSIFNNLKIKNDKNCRSQFFETKIKQKQMIKRKRNISNLFQTQSQFSIESNQINGYKSNMKESQKFRPGKNEDNRIESNQNNRNNSNMQESQTFRTDKNWESIKMDLKNSLGVKDTKGQQICLSMANSNRQKNILNLKQIQLSPLNKLNQEAQIKKSNPYNFLLNLTKVCSQ